MLKRSQVSVDTLLQQHVWPVTELSFVDLVESCKFSAERTSVVIVFNLLPCTSQNIRFDCQPLLKSCSISVSCQSSITTLFYMTMSLFIFTVLLIAILCCYRTSRSCHMLLMFPLICPWQHLPIILVSEWPFVEPIIAIL